jgi:hypothetical protein
MDLIFNNQAKVSPGTKPSHSTMLAEIHKIKKERKDNEKDVPAI